MHDFLNRWIIIWARYNASVLIHIQTWKPDDNSHVAELRRWENSLMIAKTIIQILTKRL